MPLFLKPEIIRDAVKRLVESRAQRGFTDFLILKRALKRAGQDTVPFSMRDPSFTGAIREVAATKLGNSSADALDDIPSPFFKVFGIAQGVSRKMLTNGSADTLSGPNWQNVVRLVGHRPRRGGLRSGYEDQIELLLLKREGTKPAIGDAAIWYYRATDFDSRIGQQFRKDPDILASIITAFNEDLGLTQGEVSRLFESSSAPVLSLSLNDDFQPGPADPAIYLPGEATKPIDPEKGIEQIEEAFRADAMAEAVGLHLPPGMCARFIAALLSKRFVVLTGLSGSGKTKLAQAFAQWITPTKVTADPFAPGTKIHGAQSSYTVVKANAGVLELAGDDGSLVALPMSIIEEWASYIEENAIPEGTSAREIRDKIEARSKYISYLHRLESHYKPAAFALLASRKARSEAECYSVIPVGADWTSSENIIGYPDALRTPHEGKPGSYVTTKALELIRHAADPTRTAIPHFLILDEMNLSHVERYFADILSAIESCEPIPLHDGNCRVDGRGVHVDSLITLPENLFVVGTVNVDETTYMFSPKVLDRASVIEFTVSQAEMEEFLSNPVSVDLTQLTGKGNAYAAAFVGQAARKDVSLDDISADVKMAVREILVALFAALAPVGAEFGFRPAYEIGRFIYFHGTVSGNTWNPDEAIDAAIMQKLLPKLHGSKTKLTPVLVHLKSVVTQQRFPISFAKITRMEQRLKQNGFTSYTEA
jgi:energy-coupling factor transporter ATP-binding protein EcfA2